MEEEEQTKKLTEDIDRIAGTIHKLETQLNTVDDQLNIEAPNPTISVNTTSVRNPLNYQDVGGFASRYHEEARAIGRLNEFTTQADEFVSLLYTYRSVSQPLSHIQLDQTRLDEARLKQFEILQAEIQKLHDLFDFANDVKQFFCGIVSSLVNKDRKKDFPSEPLLYHMIALLDRLVILNELKNMKACLNNDLSYFKRVYSFVRKDTSLTQVDPENHLYSFLAVQNKIFKDLKQGLRNIHSYESICVLLCNTCIDMFERELYILPEEKYMFLRVAAYLVFLIDGDKEDLRQSQVDLLGDASSGAGGDGSSLTAGASVNVFKLRKLHWEHLSRALHRNPIVPIYCDVHRNLMHVIQACPHMTPSKRAHWSIDGAEQRRLEPCYQLVNSIERDQQRVDAFLATWASTMASIRPHLAVNTYVPQYVQPVTELLIRGLRLIRDLSCAVHEQNSWKCSFPVSTERCAANRRENGDEEEEEGEFAPHRIAQYERVIRYNYSTADRSALCRYLALIKSLARILGRDATHVMPVVHRCIHTEVQQFVQHGLREPIRRAAKKKKRELKFSLLEIRELVADWQGRGPDPNDPALTGKKDGAFHPEPTLTRETAPSPTQLHLMRVLVYCLYSDRSPGMQGGLFVEKDLSSDDVARLDAFYRRSFIYPHVLALSETLSSLADLGAIWFREFFLEVAKTSERVVQFPIEMSLPWILTRHIVRSHASNIEDVFYPLSLYNDAASHALRSLRCRYLYDEIEAEANLVFDQLICLLSDQIYTHATRAAASMCLDTSYRAVWETKGCRQVDTLLAARNRFAAQPRWWSALLAQRHVEFLGRPVDISHLIARRCTVLISESLRDAIDSFRRKPVMSCVLLSMLVTVVRTAHRLLGEHVALDPWDAIFAEEDGTAHAVSFYGSMAYHAADELEQNILPNYAFNTATQRFIAAAPPRIRPPHVRNRNPLGGQDSLFLFGSRILNSAYDDIASLYKHWFGGAHMDALCTLLPRPRLVLLITRLAEAAAARIKRMPSLIASLQQAFAPHAKPTGLDLSSSQESYTRHMAAVKSLLSAEHEHLRKQAYSVFTELGNALCLLRMLDAAAASRDILLVAQIPSTLRAASFRSLSSSSSSSSSSSTSASAPGPTGPFPPSRFPLLCAGLTAVHTALEASSARPELSGASPPRSFADLWDTLSFLFVLETSLSYRHGAAACTASGEASAPPETPTAADAAPGEAGEGEGEPDEPAVTALVPPWEQFGDGFVWGGCTMLHLLRQRERAEAHSTSRHILVAEDAAETPCPESNIKVRSFLSYARSLTQLSEAVLSTLEASLVLPS